MGSALVLVGAIGCTLVAAYQWAARVGAFGAATAMLAAQNWQGRVWSTALAYFGLVAILEGRDEFVRLCGLCCFLNLLPCCAW